MPSDAELLLLDKDAVEALLIPDDVLHAVREAFTLHSRREGRVFPVVREALAGGGIFGIKSGDVPSQELLGFKAAGFWPANRRTGGEPHQATILLFNPATGRPICVIDGNAITTVRTGAAGGSGLQQLARPDSARACVFGTGVQAKVQLEFALRLMPALRDVQYISRHGGPDVRFERQFAPYCIIIAAQDRNVAVAASDIIITATPGAGSLFEAGAVRPGTRLNCVGAGTRGKRELPEGLLEKVHLVVDDREQAAQIGEAQWASGTPCQEIGTLLAGMAHFARKTDDITVFDMTGLALQDLTVAKLIYQHALVNNAGTRIAWPW